jgi:benzoyl-CoA reductase/2-hydroxyglutaryl-CoA dehydratase subunit BcrC/BadD/HgdB
VPSIVVDLPLTASPASLDFFAAELRRLGAWLEERGGHPFGPELARSIERHDELAAALERARESGVEGASLQALRLRAVALPAAEALVEVLAAPAGARSTGGVPVLLAGNMLPDPEAFSLFEQCGLRVVADDLCSGSRQLVPVALRPAEEPLRGLARAVLERPPCARTLVVERPGDLGDRIAAAAQASGARGVVAHVLKFCDPYLGRLPGLREALRRVGLPLLVLEGDCTLRSLGQYRTRLEAFAETLGRTGA